MKIYISADIEGVAGVVTEQQLHPSGFEYERARELMTNEVSACIDAAMEAGATEFIVSDSHGNGQNLLIEKFPTNTTIVRSWPRPLSMMEGVQEGCDAAILLGYHAAATSLSGVRVHSFSSAKFTTVKLNGQDVSEALFNILLAGHFDVPVIMLSGDDAVVNETKQTYPDIEYAVTKWSLGFHSARTLTPAAAITEIKNKTIAAVKRANTLPAQKLSAPITMDVSFKHYRPVELLAYLPQVERLDARSIRYVADDMVALSKFLVFISSYDAALQP